MFPCNSLDRGNIPTPNLPSLYSSVMFNPCTSDHTNLWFYPLLFSHFQKYHYIIFISNHINSKSMSLHLCISFSTSFTAYWIQLHYLIFTSLLFHSLLNSITFLISLPFTKYYFTLHFVSPTIFFIHSNLIYFTHSTVYERSLCMQIKVILRTVTIIQ